MGTEDMREETGLEPLMEIEEMDVHRGETPSPSDIPAAVSYTHLTLPTNREV